MLKDEIIALINIQNDINKEKIKSLLLLGLRFKLTSLPIATGSSKIGGFPPIFEENWPLFGGSQLMFIGQFSLSQISYIDNSLPKNGLLCFFLNVDNIKNKYPDKEGEFKVLYVESEQLRDSNKKLAPVKESSIYFFEYYTFPSYQENLILKSDLTEEDLYFIEEAEFEMKSLIDENYGIGHQVLGHPSAIQGTVRFWWGMKYFGFNDSTLLSEDKVEKVRQEEDNFILLLQLDFSDPEIGIRCFGDSVAYFGIHREDLLKRNFDNVVLVMQNT